MQQQLKAEENDNYIKPSKVTIKQDLEVINTYESETDSDDIEADAAAGIPETNAQKLMRANRKKETHVFDESYKNAAYRNLPE